MARANNDTSAGQRRKSPIMARIEDKVGVSYRQLHHWTQLGYINADNEGFRYRYSDEELRVARIIGALVNIGFRPRAAAGLARTLADDGKGGTLTLSDGKLSVSGTIANALREAQAA